MMPFELVVVQGKSILLPATTPTTPTTTTTPLLASDSVTTTSTHRSTRATTVKTTLTSTSKSNNNIHEPVAPSDDPIDSRLLSVDQLSVVREQIESNGQNLDLNQLVSICRQLLLHALALGEQAQASDVKNRLTTETLGRVQSQLNNVAAMSQSREEINQQRFEIEIEQLKLQANALVRKLVEGGSIVMEKPAYVYDPALAVYTTKNVYGSQAVYAGIIPVETELETENALLKSDLRHLKRQLRESTLHAELLERELGRLRSHLLNGAPLVTVDTEIILPPPVASSQHEVDGKATAGSTEGANPTKGSGEIKKRRRLPLMGDAEAEHLLLAGKRLSHLRRIQRIPLSAAIVQQAREIVDSGIEFANGDQFNRIVEGKMTKRGRRSSAKLIKGGTASSSAIATSSTIPGRTPPASPSKSKSFTGATTPGRSARQSANSPAKLTSRHQRAKSTTGCTTGSTLPLSLIDSLSPGESFAAGLHDLLQAAQLASTSTATTTTTIGSSASNGTGHVGGSGNDLEGLGEGGVGSEGVRFVESKGDGESVETAQHSPKRRKVEFILGNGTTAAVDSESTRVSTIVRRTSNDSELDWHSALDVLAEQAAASQPTPESSASLVDSTPPVVSGPQSPPLVSSSRLATDSNAVGGRDTGVLVDTEMHELPLVA